MWEAILEVVFQIIAFFEGLVGDWGLAIIIVTAIFRLLLTPIMFKQSKSSFQMQKMQPLMTKVRETFADDPVRQSQEMQKLYAETKFNPLTGCLPMLIQIPIFLALFNVLRNIGDYTTGTSFQFYNIVPDLLIAPSAALGSGFGAFLPYLILLLVFAGLTFLPVLLQQRQQKTAQSSQMMLMMGFMSLFMLFVGWGTPAGVLLFWGTSSIFALIQSQGSLYILRKRDAEEEAQAELRPIEVNVTRKVQKKRQSKKR